MEKKKERKNTHIQSPFASGLNCALWPIKRRRPTGNSSGDCWVASAGRARNTTDSKRGPLIIEADVRKKASCSYVAIVVVNARNELCSMRDIESSPDLTRFLPIEAESKAAAATATANKPIKRKRKNALFKRQKHRECLCVWRENFRFKQKDFV